MSRSGRVILRTLLACALLATTAWADAPVAKLRGPDTVAPGSMILLDARASVSDRPLSWKVAGPDTPWFSLDQGDRKGVVLIVPQAVAGRYVVTLIAKGTPPGANEIDADAAVWIVTVGGVRPPDPDPDPDPTPPPDPDPPPTPTTGRLHATYIADANQITVSQAIMKRARAIEAVTASLDFTWRWYASDESEISRANLTPLAAAAGLPCVLIQDHSGKVLRTLKKPTAGEVVAAIKAIRRVQP